MSTTKLSKEVVGLLEQGNFRLVLAESCTAGMISASLGLVPGVSQYLCGSAVVYREQTKIDWLDVDPASIESFTAESENVTREIALGVLKKTPEAHWSLGITGHLGPGSPSDVDGKIFR